MKSLDWPAASALASEWGYASDGGWPGAGATQSFSAHQEKVMPSAIPHRAAARDRRLLAEAAPEFADAVDSARWLAVLGRCGQTHHLEDEQSIDPAATWPDLSSMPLAPGYPFSGGLLLERDDLYSAVPALASAAFAGQADVKLLAADCPLMIGFCHDGDLHFESTDLDLLRDLRSRALELGFYTDPPDDWP